MRARSQSMLTPTAPITSLGKDCYSSTKSRTTKEPCSQIENGSNISWQKSNYTPHELIMEFLIQNHLEVGHGKLH